MVTALPAAVALSLLYPAWVPPGLWIRFILIIIYLLHLIIVEYVQCSEANSLSLSCLCFVRSCNYTRMYTTFSKSVDITPSNSYNEYINKYSNKVKIMYENLPDNSIIKHPESLVFSRMVLSYSEVIEVLYRLDSNKSIEEYFYLPDKFNLAGIYCFLSKDVLSYYIGSSLNMQRRYNRHMFNLKQHSDKRYSEANPKFYNYLNKYGIESLSFGCLLEINNYLGMFSGFYLTEDEKAFLTLLMQLDLLITEQFFLDTLGLSLNVASKVGTRESSILSDETKKKMSDSHLNIVSSLSEDQWKAIRAKAVEAWSKEGPDSNRKTAISEFHGRAVIVKDGNNKVIGEFNSVLKVSEYLGVNRNKVSTYLNSGDLLESSLGSVYLLEKGDRNTERERSSLRPKYMFWMKIVILCLVIVV